MQRNLSLGAAAATASGGSYSNISPGPERIAAAFSMPITLVASRLIFSHLGWLRRRMNAAMTMSA
jgi:hypothetical protein